jgi:hypothetical protein
MFKELEHRTQFSNLVHYSEVTDLYVLYIHVRFYRCFPRQDRQLFVGSTFGANGVNSNTNKGAWNVNQCSKISYTLEQALEELITT